MLNNESLKHKKIFLVQKIYFDIARKLHKKKISQTITKFIFDFQKNTAYIKFEATKIKKVLILKLTFVLCLSK